MQYCLVKKSTDVSEKLNAPTFKTVPNAINIVHTTYGDMICHSCNASRINRELHNNVSNTTYKVQILMQIVRLSQVTETNQK
jgi:hypothetical protein